MAGGPADWGLIQRQHRDASATHERLKPCTFGRIAGFAAPHRRMLASSVVIIVSDAVVSAAVAGA